MGGRCGSACATRPSQRCRLTSAEPARTVESPARPAQRTPTNPHEPSGTRLRDDAEVIGSSRACGRVVEQNRRLGFGGSIWPCTRPGRRWRGSRPTGGSPIFPGFRTRASSRCPGPLRGSGGRARRRRVRRGGGVQLGLRRGRPVRRGATARPARRRRVDAAVRAQLLRAGQLRRAGADLARPARRCRVAPGRTGRRGGVPVVVDRDQRDHGRRRAPAALRGRRRQRRTARCGAGRRGAAGVRTGLRDRDDRGVARGPAGVGAAGRACTGTPDRPGRAGAGPQRAGPSGGGHAHRLAGG